jgi:hypothetical protein
MKLYFDEAFAFMQTEEIRQDAQLTPYLYLITGYRYSMAICLGRSWGETEEDDGEFYQIMPDEEDGGFFDWYCQHRTDYQFFKTLNAAVVHFVFFWHLWQNRFSENSLP